MGTPGCVQGGHDAIARRGWKTYFPQTTQGCRVLGPAGNIPSSANSQRADIE